MGLYWGYMGIMEEKMETTRDCIGLYGIAGCILGLYWDIGQENGNDYNIVVNVDP